MRLPPLGIRARTALTATVVVGVALVASSVVLVFTMRYAVGSSIRAAAATRASDVALLARSGSLPAAIPGRGESLLVQVLDSGSRVVAASPSIDGDPPLASVSLRPGGTRTFTLASLPESGRSQAAEVNFEPSAPFVVAAQAVSTTSGPVTVLVAASLSPLEDTSDALVPLLLGGVPVVLLVVAATTWALTGLALRPVAAIRKDAEAISSSIPDRRLPVPPARDEIRDLAETMNRMLDRIETASLAHRRFALDASHELKSPIAAIRTMLEVARQDPSGADVPALLDDLLAEDQRLERLVSDLLLLGRSDEGGLRLSLSRLDLSRLIEEEVATVARRDARRIGTRDVEAVTLTADADRIRQLMRNLLDNAVRHASDRVWVGAREQDGCVVLTVSDDGPGIPEEARERVFERFVRLDEGRGRDEGGSGLGLSVCREIVRAHGGELRFADPEHGGATAEVRIPS
ncbi:MAG TPA: ATP-binding protein [Coriobacteriia bacterium]